ncbi:MAG: response regulator, partial [Spirochaetaceae bacterium]|nr:response regulator [Spirochaetaceae bacterium]
MKHIFVVDDSITTLKLAESALKNHFELTLLTSGTQLFAALSKKRPDLILLDIEMPDIDGMTILEKLKSVIGWESIPVIFLTSH